MRAADPARISQIGRKFRTGIHKVPLLESSRDAPFSATPRSGRRQPGASPSRSRLTDFLPPATVDLRSDNEIHSRSGRRPHALKVRWQPRGSWSGGVGMMVLPPPQVGRRAERSQSGRKILDRHSRRMRFWRPPSHVPPMVRTGGPDGSGDLLGVHRDGRNSHRLTVFSRQLPRGNRHDPSLPFHSGAHPLSYECTAARL